MEEVNFIEEENTRAKYDIVDLELQEVEAGLFPGSSSFFGNDCCPTING